MRTGNSTFGSCQYLSTLLLIRGHLTYFLSALAFLPALRGRSTRPSMPSNRSRKCALPKGRPARSCRRNSFTSSSSTPADKKGDHVGASPGRRLVRHAFQGATTFSVAPYGLVELRDLLFGFRCHPIQQFLARGHVVNEPHGLSCHDGSVLHVPRLPRFLHAFA